MTLRKATNITWYDANVNRKERETLLNQKGIVLWFTGLSGSGKSTIAHAVENKLYSMGRLTYVLDGDNIRHGINQNLGFSPEDRKENIRRIGEITKLFVDTGVITLAAFISPYYEDRRRIRDILDDRQFAMVYVYIPLEVVEKRDPKGLYKKARAGEIKQFTGIDAPYEEPRNPEIVVDTSRQSVDECVDIIIKYLIEKKVITI